MKDIRHQKLANLLVNYSLRVKEGEFIVLLGIPSTLPLLKELYREVLRAGAHPQIILDIPDEIEILLKEGNDEQIKYITPFKRTFASECDAMIGLWGDINTKRLSGVDPNKLAMMSRSRSEVSKVRFEREAKGEFRWVGTMYPMPANAQDASMSLEEYEDFVFGAGLLDKDDPITQWKRISKEQQKVVDYLDTKKEIHIISKDTDLKCNYEGRNWVNCDGRVNFPDGEVFTSPVKTKVEGYIRFSYPGIYQGKEIEDIRLEFKEGKVVKASAAKGEELLNALLDTDEGSRYLGEIAIGTNYNINKFTKHMLFDEKMGGTVHAALGKALPDAKGKNQSNIHWDMLCDMKECGEIYADGELFYKNGKFINEIINK